MGFGPGIGSHFCALAVTAGSTETFDVVCMFAASPAYDVRLALAVFTL